MRPAEGAAGVAAQVGGVDGPVGDLRGQIHHLVAETIGHTADKRRVVDGRRVDTDVLCRVQVSTESWHGNQEKRMKKQWEKVHPECGVQV